MKAKHKLLITCPCCKYQYKLYDWEKQLLTERDWALYRAARALLEACKAELEALQNEFKTHQDECFIRGQTALPWPRIQKLQSAIARAERIEA